MGMHDTERSEWSFLKQITLYFLQSFFHYGIRNYYVIGAVIIELGMILLFVYCPGNDDDKNVLKVSDFQA